MNIRFHHARLLTMEHGMTVTTGELWTEGDCVTYVGPPCDASAVQWDREVDVRGDLLMPGFKNAHTHSAMTFLRSFADDLPLQDWLQTQVFPMEAKLAGRDVYELSRLAILEYLTCGITANFDMYFMPDQIAEAAVDSGFRTVLCSPMNNFTGSLSEQESCYHRLNGANPLLGYRLGFHAEYTTSEGLLRGLSELAHRLEAPVYSHNSETKSEVEGCLSRHGMTPTAYFDSLGLFDYGGGGFHCVHMTDNDLAIFRNRGLWAVTNPASNCKLASGVAPLQKMRRLGVGLAIGTDGPASNNCLDMFREMFLATALQKLALSDASAAPASDILYMATAGGARAMGLHGCDCLAPGKQADLILIDLHQPNMQPENNLVDNLVYSGSKQNVRLTMVGGRILYENGEFYTGADPEELYAYANQRVRAMRGEL